MDRWTSEIQIKQKNPIISASRKAHSKVYGSEGLAYTHRRACNGHGLPAMFSQPVHNLSTQYLVRRHKFVVLQASDYSIVLKHIRRNLKVLGPNLLV